MSTATNGSLTDGTFTDATDNPGTVNPYSNDTRRGADTNFDVAETYGFDNFAAGEGEFDDNTMHNFTYVSATGAIVTGQFLTQEVTNTLNSTIDCYMTGTRWSASSTAVQPAQAAAATLGRGGRLFACRNLHPATLLER